MVEVEELSFYYRKMVDSNLLELEVELPAGKMILKRYDPNQNPANLRRRRTDFISDFPSTSDHAINAFQQNYKQVTSPLNGVFYRSPSPQSAAFVQDGTTVEQGTTLCIIEAMKVMNEIKADCKCKIVQILEENGTSVIKGQALFNIDPIA